MRKEIKFGIITVTLQGTTILAKEKTAVFACKRFRTEVDAENVFATLEEMFEDMKQNLDENNIAHCVCVRRVLKEQIR